MKAVDVRRLRGVEPIEIFEDNRDEARWTLKALRAKARGRGRGRPPAGVVDFMIGGAPPFERDPEDPTGVEPWSAEKRECWYKESVAWVREMAGPESIFLVLTGHNDEKSPHIQGAFIPIHDGNLGWAKVRDDAIRRMRPEGARHVGTLSFVALQDSIAERFAAFGLARGQRGSAAEHERPDRAEAELHNERTAVDRTCSAQASLAVLAAEADLEEARFRGAQADRNLVELEARRAVAQARTAREREEDRLAELQREEEAMAGRRDALREEAAAAAAARQAVERKTKDLRDARAEADDELRQVVLETAEAERKREAAIEAGKRDLLGRRGRSGQALIDAAAAAERGRDEAKASADASAKAELDAYEAQAAAEHERDVAREALAPVTKECNKLRRQVLEHPEQLAAAEARGFADGVRSAIEAIGRYGASVGGRAAHMLSDLVGWIRTGAEDRQLTSSQDAREQARDGARGLG